jgi:hypothetical protein
MRRPMLRDWLGLLWLLLGAACSSPTDEYQPITSTPDDYCQRRCEKAHTCTETINPAECRSSCRSTLATEPKPRADFLGYVAGCVENSACGSASVGKCTSEARAQLSLSKYGQTFCGAFVATGNQCDDTGAAYPESACFEAGKTYDDGALASANECLSKPCAELSACLARTMPKLMLTP